MNKFDFKNRTAVITGGGQGFGLDIAKRFLESGARVIIWDIDEDLLKSAANEVNNENLSYDVVDVSNYTQVEKSVSQITSKNNIDILINNAGMAARGKAYEMSYDMWKKVVDVNLNGAFLCARGAMKIMVPQKSGRIINIGSISGQMGRPENAPYTATKFAVEGLTRAFALDGRDHGVAVSVIHPGNVATDIISKDEIPKRKKEGFVLLEDLGKLAITMLTISPNVNILGSVVLPITQPYLGRG